jgi:hypothetical protein
MLFAIGAVLAACTQQSGEAAPEASGAMMPGATLPACGDVPSGILAKSCAGAACHSAADRAGGLDLGSPGLETRMLSQGRVDPQHPTESQLYVEMTASPKFGARMPLGLAPLDDAQMKCVASWIGGIQGSPSGSPGSSGGPTMPGGSMMPGDTASVPPLFVAVGYGGRRMSSADGKTWTDATDLLDDGGKPAPDGDNGYLLRGVCSGQGKIIAVGGIGDPGPADGLIMQSKNGRDWTRVKTKDPINGFDCEYGNGVFTVGGAYSSDGESWTLLPDGEGPPVNTLAFGAGVFVAADDRADGRSISYSTDGKKWTDAKVNGTSQKFNHVAFGGGRFVAILGENQDNGGLAESTDGKTWTSKRLEEVWGSTFRGGLVVHQGDTWFVYGDAGILRRKDGANDWTKQNDTPDAYVIAANKNVFVSADRWSTDGVTFTDATFKGGSEARRFGISKIIWTGP